MGLRYIINYEGNRHTNTIYAHFRYRLLGDKLLLSSGPGFLNHPLLLPHNYNASGNQTLVLSLRFQI